ncbi:MAG: PAS domain-containing protein, partial [Thermodesulfovibrionales bacterium]|nr:PAS domain-containing protein [Thermodesulfovibrionales bacterium]
MLDNNYHTEDLIYKNIFTEDKIPRLLIDPRNGRVIEANKAAALLFGLKGEKLKNENITDILPIDPQTLLLELTKVLAGNKDFFVLKATSDRFARDILVVYP